MATGLISKLRNHKLATGLFLALSSASIANPTQAEATHYTKVPVPQVSYSRVVKEPNFSTVELAPKSPGNYELDLISRIHRTERWRPIINTVEDIYGIPRDIIYAVVMNESYGDPVQPNATGDGGLGLVHFQPRTARDYGLDIHGSSRRVRDRRHGRQLVKIIRDCKYDTNCLLEYDDRAHPIKNIDAIARYLKDGYERKRTWEGAVQTINPGGRGYSQRIFKFRDAVQTHRSKAEQDFNGRNRGKKIDGKPLTFDFYIKSFWRMNQNYELEKYKRQKHGQAQPRARQNRRR